jgi:PAS domain S-box-containing protein
MTSYSPNGVDPNISYQAVSEDAERVVGRAQLPPAMSAFLRYGLAMLTVSVAFVLARAFLFYGLPLPFTAFALSAIAVTFWYGGTKPGILAALIAWLVRDYLFEPEIGTESRILYGLAFLIFALVMTLVMRDRNELEARVAERTAELRKANEDLTFSIARLRGTEDELRAIMDSAPVFLWSDLPNGYCDFLNQPWLTYFNLSLQEAQGAGWTTLLHPDDAARHLESWQKSISTATTFETESRFRLPDGQYRWFLSRANPLRDKTGRIVKWYGTNVDIENLKQTESRLRQSEAYLAEAQRLSHTGTWVLNPTTMQYLYWSDECYRIWGFDPLQGLPSREALWQRIHDRERVWEDVQEALRQKKDYAGEFKIVLPDGTVKYLAATCHHLFSTHGEIVEVIGTNIDVTERRHAEEALRESEYNLRQIIETVPGHLWSTDPNGEPTHLNQHLIDYFGLQLEDAKQCGWEAFLHPNDRAETAKAFHHAIQTGASYQKVHRLRRADGEYRWHHSRAEPLRDGQGAIIQWYGLSVDIDEAQQAEDQLSRSEAYLAEAQRLSNTGSWALSPDARKICYWSEECYRIWGFDPAQGLPDREAVWRRIHPGDRDRMYEETQEALLQKRDYKVEFRIVLPDGTVKDLEATGHHLFSAQGELIEVVGTNIDVTERKRAEQALRKSEAKIRRLVDANIIGIFIWDFDGRILEANKAFLDIVGYDHEDLVACRVRWTDLTPPEWRDRDARLIQEQRVTGSLQPFEKEYFRKDGSRVPVLIGVATFEEAGNQGVAFVLDLTKRKQAEEALRESEYKLRQIVETVPSLIWSLAPDGEPTHFNQRQLDYFGMSFEDLKHRGRGAFVHPDDVPEHEKAFSHAIQTGTSYQGVLRLRRADGEYRWHHARGEPLRDRDGRIVQWYGVSVDIDDAKKGEDRLRRSEAYLAEAQRLGHTGVAAYNETTILYGSEEIFRIWGFDPAQGVPSRDAVFQRIHTGDRDRLNAEVQRAVGEKRAYSIGYRIVLPDGTVKHLEAIGQPVFSASGELVEIVTTQIDVTERKRAEQAHEKLRRLESDLAHMNRLSVMGELTASLAHEITQPIASARNNARAALNFLDNNPPDLGEVREGLHGVVGNADRAGDIVDRIRDQINKAPPRKLRFDLNEAINEVIALVRSAVSENGVSVQTRLTDGLVLVSGDRVQLQQVVLNLILNAVEAMSAVEAGTRELLISTGQDQAGEALVAVHDSGPGIDPEHLERVFESFYTTKSSGVGMGLSICRSIIDAHEGRLWAEANDPRGAAFQFTLPSAEKEITSAAPAAQQTGERHEDTVLVGLRQMAYEGNKSPHHSRREPGQGRWGKQ